MDDSILIPDYQNSVNKSTSSPSEYLKKDNFLSEYQTEGEKGVVRDNLNVPSRDAVYSKQDANVYIAQKIYEAIQEHLNNKDPHQIIQEVVRMMEGVIKQDGSINFTSPQSGVDPISKEHLTTKNYVDELIKQHKLEDNPHNLLTEINNLLKNYAKLVDVYTKDQSYNKDEINLQSKNYINKDGSVPFSNVQIGVDPELDAHLATKRYVDKLVNNHKDEINPHGFITILNQQLSNYIKKVDVYDKTETYSKDQINSIINNIVSDSIDASLEEYSNTIDTKINQIKSQEYVKQDGSTPFKAPQTGIDATQLSHLTTLRQLKQAINDIQQNVDLQLQSKDFTWRPSGPVETTVGFIKDNTQMPEIMTFQEVCEAIFYGRGFRMEVPKYVNITQEIPITIYIKGSEERISKVEVYQNGTLIHTLQVNDFVDGVISINSLPVQEDTIILVKVYNTDGTTYETSQTIKCNMPVFVGLLPKWKFANTITMEYLNQLVAEDFDGTQNRFFNYSKDVSSIAFKYVFQDASLRHPFIVLPINYPNLDSIVTKSQSFGIDAFDVIDSIPLHIDGVEEDVIYKIYVYREALLGLNSIITYNFE